MIKKKLKNIPLDIPETIRGFISDCSIYDSSSSPEAKTFFIKKGRGFYLKTSEKGSLKKEEMMTRFIHKKNLSSEVIEYISSDKDWLLTPALEGEDCSYFLYLNSPQKLSETIAIILRNLHELDFYDCPIQNRTKEYLETVERNYSLGIYNNPNGFGYKNVEEAYSVFLNGKNSLNDSVLIHGDYCLPNIILKNWKLSGFVDLGCGGRGERHIDLFWGLWTLWFNLKSDKYSDIFLDSYGRDKVDKDKLKLISTCEVFG